MRQLDEQVLNTNPKKQRIINTLKTGVTYSYITILAYCFTFTVCMIVGKIVCTIFKINKTGLGAGSVGAFTLVVLLVLIMGMGACYEIGKSMFDESDHS